MILSETVKLKWNGRNKKYFVDKGYKFTKLHEEFDVRVEDLCPTTKVKIECICDNCNKKYETRYDQYYIRSSKPNDYCFECAYKITASKIWSENTYKNGNSFYSWCIENDRQDILNRWDYELTGFSPKDISKKSTKTCWLRCDLHPETHKPEPYRISGFANDYEHTAITCRQCNSFAQYGIDNYGEDFLNKYWDYDKNIINPFDLSFGSHEPIYLICQNGHGTYKTTPNYFSNYGDRCPQCKQEDNESFLQKKVRLYLEDLCEVDRVYHENQCTLYPINPKTGYKLPFDNDVLLKNRKHLIIEVNGGQHYNVTGFHYQLAEKNGTTPEEELAYQQWKDEYKKQYALSHGYEYLAIPYWTEKDESYKQLIDDKIVEINNKLKCKGD